MAKFVKALVVAVTFLGSSFLWNPVQAELIFNIQHSDFKQPSREAGASLLNSIASVLQMLSAVEIQRDDAVRDTQESAIGMLEDTVQMYRALSDSMRKLGRNIDYRDLPEDRIGSIRRTFEFYSVEIPQTESDVIILGFRESREFLKELSEADFKFDGEDRERSMSVIFSIDRILILGTAASEVAQTAR